MLWFALAFLAYWIWLDHVVAQSFAARQWALPARVYASPLELYEGVRVDPDYLETNLMQLGYTRTAKVDAPGQFFRKSHDFEIHSRGYAFPDGRDPSHRFSLRFDGDLVTALKHISDNDPVPLVRLEPVEIGSVHARTFEDRIILPIAETPQAFLDILVASEDRRYLRHFGLDPIGIVRAAFSNLLSGRVEQGGSTITQQLVKNMYLSNERSLGRKFREALMAISLERRFSKAEIMEAYVNEIFLGQDGNRAIHGFGLGSRFYFGKPIGELSVAEMATLVGMVKAPSTYNPQRKPAAAKQRRDVVLGLLLAQGIVSTEVHAKALASELVVRDRLPIRTRSFSAFLDLVRIQLNRDYQQADLRSAGLKIYTTLDPRVQQAAQDIATESLKELEKKKNIAGTSLQTAAVLIDPRTSEVRGLVGGRGGSPAGFNRALNARRSIGSLVKPFIYLAALEQTERFNVLSVLEDKAVHLDTANGEVWSPKNYDGKLHGQVSLRQALVKSYNLATVNLGLALGVKTVATRLRELGVERELDDLPSLLLGSIDLTPIEVAQLYQGIANDGFRIPLRAIRSVTNAQNETLRRYSPQVERVSDPAVTYLLQYLLTQVVAQGTARSAGIALQDKLPLAGKTGTSNEGRDSWFAGFGADVLSVVWVGRDDNGATGLTGASGALRVWTGMIRRLGITPFQFTQPDGLQWLWVAPAGNAIVAEQCEGATRIPLALPHGLPELGDCGASEPDKGGLWGRIRGLIQ